MPTSIRQAIYGLLLFISASAAGSFIALTSIAAANALEREKQEAENMDLDRYFDTIVRENFSK